jgi:hypothetical protein
MPAPVRAVDATAVDHLHRHGWLLVDTLDGDDVVALQQWVDEIAAWPDDDARWMHHRELTEHGPRLCRSENFVPYHGGLGALLTTGRLVADASALLGEPAVLYKEKVNYKAPGGAGYSPHQDAPAYPFVDTHISCMLAIDDATVDNGCLEVVDGPPLARLPTDDRGCVTPDVVESLAWTPVEVRAGQTLWFHSLTPHRSGPNHSSTWRRALYPTYNALAEGDRRDDYYRAKRAELAGTGGGDQAVGDRAGGDHAVGDRVVVSLIGDFEGRPVR